jgi:hypothetical protein
VIVPEILGSWSETGPETGRRVHTTRVRFRSIQDELKFLRQVIDDWRGRAWTRETAKRVVFDNGGCEPKKRLCHALAVAEWVQETITYVNERPETFQTPQRTVDLGMGDCDDQTVLVGALLEAVGIPVQVVGMRIDGQWRHVFPRAVVRLPGGRNVVVSLDTTLSLPVRQLVDPVARSKKRGRSVETYTA